MKKALAVFLIIVSIIVLLGVGAAAGLSVMTYMKVSDMESRQIETPPEGSVEGEDNITIGGSYRILSTKAISDAYISGDSSALSEKDKETLQMASDILAQIITDSMSDFEKEQAVFTWMNEKIGDDPDVTVLVRDNSTDNPHGVLSGRSAVCVGYATTFRLFMQMLDIPCMVVHNTDLVHSWDLVQIDGHWYHVDLYSANGERDPKQYLNRNDELQGYYGYSWDMSFYPAADSLEKSYIYMNSEAADDIYTIPSTLKKAIDDQKPMLSLIIPDSDNVQTLAENMLGSIEGKLMSSVEYQSISLTHQIVSAGGDGILVYIKIDDYSVSDDDDDITDITDDELERIDKAINDSFGDLTYNEYYGDYDFGEDGYVERYFSCAEG